MKWIFGIKFFGEINFDLGEDFGMGALVWRRESLYWSNLVSMSMALHDISPGSPRVDGLEVAIWSSFFPFGSCFAEEPSPPSTYLL